MTDCVHSVADTSLVCDAMLGRLTTYLRMCGYDTASALDRGIEDDEALLRITDGEDRLLLTRDRDLSHRSPAAKYVDSTAIEDQLRELHATGFELALTTPMRCSHCNGDLDRVPPTAATDDRTPDPGAEPVWECHDCGHRFWQGSHWEDVQDRLKTRLD